MGYVACVVIGAVAGGVVVYLHPDKAAVVAGAVSKVADFFRSAKD